MLTPSASWSTCGTCAAALGRITTRWRAELHDLLTQVQNPNVHGLNKELTHRVEHLNGVTPLDQYPEMYRILSANASSALARAAFEAACKCYPNQRLILKWGSYVVERYEPKKRA